MSIRFESSISHMPSKKDLLDNAAGVGIMFDEDSLAEVHFLEFCKELYAQGFNDGLDAMQKNLMKFA
jgi:hypothetical protein